MGVNSLPKTITRQRRGCDLNPDATAPESSTQPLGAKLIWENNSVYTYESAANKRVEAYRLE